MTLERFPDGAHFRGDSILLVVDATGSLSRAPELHNC